MDRLYDLTAPQGGYFTARQAGAAGVSRQTLSYHATDGGSLERVGSAVYRLRRFPEPSHGHVIAGWLALARADAVVSHDSALELLDVSDVIADQVHVTLPRDKRGLAVPSDVRAHYTVRPPGRAERQRVAGVPVTSVERTVADLLRTGGWTEQIDLAVQQSIRRGLTTARKLRAALPAKWQPRLEFNIERAPTNADPGGGQRWSVTANVAGRVFERAAIDIDFATAPVLGPQTIVSSELLAFADVWPVRIPTLAVEQHVAEKLHAYTHTYAGERSSSRVKDLVDLVVIANTTELDAKHLDDAIDEIFNRRATHARPTAVPAPPKDWAAAWRRLVTDLPADAEVDPGHRAVASFLDPVLARVTRHGIWNPTQRRWRDA